MRSPRFLRWMTRLALAAVLLLLLAPTFSRWLASQAVADAAGAGGMVMGMHHAMADADGKQMAHHALDASGMAMHHPMPAVDATSDTTSAPMDGMHDEFCGYCVLLSSLAPILLLLALVLRVPERVSLSSFRPVPAHKLAPWVGLGARGPPILL